MPLTCQIVQSHTHDSNHKNTRSKFTSYLYPRIFIKPIYIYCTAYPEMSITKKLAQNTLTLH